MLGQYNTAVGVSECRGMPPAIDKGFNLKLKSKWALALSHVSPVFVCLGLLQLLNNNVELVALSLESLKYKSDHCSHWQGCLSLKQFNNENIFYSTFITAESITS